MNWTEEDRLAIEALFDAFLPAERPLRRAGAPRRPARVERLLVELDPFSLRAEDLVDPERAWALSLADVETLAFLLPGICRAALAERRASLLLERLNHQLLRTMSARRLAALHRFLSHLEARGWTGDPSEAGRLRLMVAETRVMEVVLR